MALTFVSVKKAVLMLWFKKKSKSEKLNDKYKHLMKKSFELALVDKHKSEKVHHQAEKLFQEIKQLSFPKIDE